MFRTHTEVSEIETGGIEPGCNLGPIQRGGNGSVRPSAHGVRANHGLQRAISKWVEIDTIASPGDGVCNRGRLGMRRGNACAEFLRELQHLVGCRADPNRNEYVDSATSGGFGIGMHTYQV